MTQNKPSDACWGERAARLFVLLSLGALAYFFLGTLLGLLLPFLLAAALAALLRPLGDRIARKSRLSPRVASVLLLLVFLLLTGSVIVWGCQRLILELQKLVDQIGTDGERWSQRIYDIIDVVTRLTEHIPFLARLRGKDHTMGEFWKQMDARLAEILSDMLTRLSARIPDLLASIIRAIPGTAIFFLTFLLSAFYLCTAGKSYTIF